MNYDPVILLAAGNSTRVGIPKALVKLNEKFWLHEQLDRLSAVGISQVFLVLGFHGREIQDALKQLNPKISTSRTQIKIVWNPRPERGAFSSLQTGIRETFQNPGTQGCYILPIDVPVAPEETWTKIKKGTEEAVDSLVTIPTYSEKGGHPVWLKKDFAMPLTAIPTENTDARLDLQIRNLDASDVLRVPVTSKEVSLNLNTLDEFREYFR